MKNKKNQAAVALGKKRQEKMTPEQRSKHASMMNKIRWAKAKKKAL